jgi:hypothetical protein
MTPPRSLRHPPPESAAGSLKQLDRILRIEKAGPVIDRALDRAEFFLDQARRNGSAAQVMRRLEATYQSLKGQAHDLQRAALKVEWPLTLTGSKRVKYASNLNTQTVKDALLDPSHWASKDYRASLDFIICGNQRIPDAIKPQLYRDVARVLELAPHGGGIVKALTLRGQRGASGAQGKLGNRGNAGIGYAYEFMGTAALSYGASTPRNAGASPLYIEPGVHTVSFGNKVPLDRRLVNAGDGLKPGLECDISIYDPRNGREIGVDFKHTESTKHSSAKDKAQIDAVVQAIKERQIDEYHFVTNKTFGEGFMRDIAAANEVLAARGDPLIGCHEYVSTLK